MSLNYKLTDIDDWKVVCFDGNGGLKMITQSLIFSMMSVEMGEITEANAAEFWARLNVCQTYVGPWFRMGLKGDPVLISKEDVVTHIGLHTNVKTRTRRQWLNGWFSEAMNADVHQLETLLTGLHSIENGNGGG